MSESILQRIERIARDHNISRREALHVALAESRFESRQAELAAVTEGGDR